jgi:hypothetical protein
MLTIEQVQFRTPAASRKHQKGKPVTDLFPSLSLERMRAAYQWLIINGYSV